MCVETVRDVTLEERPAEVVYTRQFDEYGNLVAERRGIDQDGRARLIISFQYNDHGDLIRESRDGGADGSVDSVRELVYNSYGKVLQETLDRGLDGKIEIRRTFHYSGINMVREVVDINDDGKLDEELRYEHDLAGRIIVQDLDLGADGSIELTIRYIWDKSALVEKSLQDDSGESRYRYYYNEVGRRVRAAFYNSLGIMETHEEMRYTDSGLEMNYRRYRGSELEWETTYDYDRAHRRHDISDFDHGVLVRDLRFEYECG